MIVNVFFEIIPIIMYVILCTIPIIHIQAYRPRSQLSKDTDLIEMTSQSIQILVENKIPQLIPWYLATAFYRGKKG